ncbi:hypothetical protein [Colwellia sp. TT2012]|uniref:hypothetical protein n=1 Tax=Colwellia sp. TT2012 TaxID=1720342 RepID=UPI00070A0B47|nr:hypothetical protein [Colwellia sp. TT2012]
MSLLSQLINPLSLIAAITASSVFAGDMPIDNHIVYDRGDTVYGGANYEIDRMLVNWDNNDQITVNIYTNFGAHNNDLSEARGGRSIIFGDLLLGTTGSQSDFNYAFSLGELTSQAEADVGWDNYYGNVKVADHERYFRHGEDTSNTYSTGGLYAIDGTQSSTPDYHQGGGVEVGQVFGNVADRNNKAAAGSWTVNNSSTEFDIFSFSFNVANIDAFQNADQLALSWTMSCFNDVITALITKTPGTNPIPVPTPASSLLLLLGLALISFRKKSTVNKAGFSA